MLRKALLASGIICAITLMAGCNIAPRDNMFDPGSDNYYRGQVLIRLSSDLSRTIDPLSGMDILSYRISLTGPDGITRAIPNSDGTELVLGLEFGTWTIDVAGYSGLNQTGFVIGEGSSTITISNNQRVIIPISVIPVDGAGGLDVDIVWDYTISNPVVTATLTDLNNVSYALTQAPDLPNRTITMSTTANALPDGYYTLSVVVSGNGVQMGGAVEIVRIADGFISTGTLSCSINSEGGMDITITTAMNNPLVLGLSGASATMTSTATMAVTASISNIDVSGTVYYSWYIDGVAQGPAGTASSYTINGSAFLVGPHRLDVVAHSADLNRAGSVSHIFTITQ